MQFCAVLRSLGLRYSESIFLGIQDPLANYATVRAFVEMKSMLPPQIPTQLDLTLVTILQRLSFPCSDLVVALVSV